MKMSVLYHSRSGNTKRMAECICEGMEKVDGSEARAFAIDAIDEEFVVASDCIVIGTPTYLATMSGEMKTWLDTSGKLKLAGKLGGAFATADYIHGGGEIAIQSLLSHLMVKGMLTYSGGGAFGKPVIHLGPVAIKENLDDFVEVFRLYGQRMATTAQAVFGGKR